MKYIGIALGTGLLATAALCANAASKDSKPNNFYPLRRHGIRGFGMLWTEIHPNA